MLRNNHIFIQPGIPVMILSLLVWSAPAATAEPVWTWNAFTDQGDVWLRSAADGQGMFDFRLGAGGAIAEMRDVQAGAKRLLSPSFQGEATDRIIQWTWWSDSITNPIAGLPAFEHRFNVTQGGTFSNQISPTMSVRIRSGVNIVDVYSLPQDQWKTQQQPHMQGKISALTRYEMAADGVLKIRRVMLVDHVYLRGEETQFDKLYVEAWSPFDRSGTFDGLALGVDANGNPNWWYQAGNNIPHYPNFPVASTNGYAVVFRIGSHQTNTAVGLVFGLSQVSPATTGNSHVLNSMSWNNGIGILPALNLSNVALGSVIDTTIALVPRHSLNAEMAGQLATLVPQIPAPVVHAPATAFAGELGDIVTRLKTNLTQSGQRTQHLAAVAVPIASAQEEWRLDHFGNVQNSGNAADLADANDDGEVNLLEFATAQNPHASTLAHPTLMRNGSTLEFTYIRSKAALGDGLTFSAQWSDTLEAGSWSSAGVMEEIQDDNGTVQTVQASMTEGEGPRHFFRLRVTKP